MKNFNRIIKKLKLFLFVITPVITFSLCKKSVNPTNNISESIEFCVNIEFILKNGFPFENTAIIYFHGYRGYLPWEIETSTSLPAKFMNSNKLGESNIQSINSANPEINKYTVNFRNTVTELNATETLLAEVTDYIKSYETSIYGNNLLVSHAIDFRTADQIEKMLLKNES